MNTMKADVRIHTENRTQHAIIFQPKRMKEAKAWIKKNMKKEAQTLFEWTVQCQDDLEKVLKLFVERINQPAGDSSKEIAQDGLNDSDSSAMN